MSFPAESRPQSRARLLHVAAATWLLLISAAVIIDHVALSRLADNVQASAPNIQVAMLDSRLADLERRMDAADRRPASLTQDSFDAARQALEARLVTLEQAASTQATAADIALLQRRLEQLEVRVREVRQVPPLAAAPARRPPPAEAARPATPEPPFRLLGIELRAGERFLSIAPVGARSLAEARVLRLGETESGWQLEALEGRTAVFRFDGQTRQLALP